VVTEGFRDVLEIGTQRRPVLHSLTQQRAAPLVPRSRVFEVRERLDAFGKIVQPLQAEEVDNVVKAVSASGPEAVAVSLLFGFLNGSHEQHLGEALRNGLPGIPVYLSQEINPQIEEFARASTTAAAAYVGPVLDRYIEGLERGLAEAAFAAPLMLMRSDGGVATPKAARVNPATMLLSGSAGGVIAAANLSRVIDAPNIITFDMGGTSADFSLITGGAPAGANDRDVDGQALRVPMLDIVTISAGGGSIASVDHAGGLHVGPQSAGAVPGPACYGRGGLEATLTDALVVLGIIDPADFAGGSLPLDGGAARVAVERSVARPLGVDSETAALGMVAVASAHMRQTIRALTVERGHDMRQFSLLAFGGAGPIFAAFMEPELRIEQVLVPLQPGVLAAFGLLLAKVKHNAQASFAGLVKDVSADELGCRLEGLRAGLDASLAREGLPANARHFIYAADLRYEGQFHDITVPLEPPKAADWWRPEAVTARFHALHDKVYGHNDPAGTIEIVNLRVEGIGDVEKPWFPEAPARTGGGPEPVGRRRVCVDRSGVRLEMPVYRRADLRCGDRLAGPALVSQSDTTVLVLPGQVGSVDRHGVIRIRSKAS
jgi:N-methylhydantoinase A